VTDIDIYWTTTAYPSTHQHCTAFDQLLIGLAENPEMQCRKVNTDYWERIPIWQNHYLHTTYMYSHDI